MTKICTICLIIKSIDEFSKDKYGKNGYKSACKACNGNKARQYNLNNSDKLKKVTKEWVKNNREKHHCSMKTWYSKNKDYVLEYGRQRYKTKPEIIKNYNRKRRELKKVDEYKFKVEHEKEIYEIFQSQCFKCGGKDCLALDHYIPLAKGGQLEVGNVVLLCKSCNSKKWKHDPSKFFTLEERIRLKCYYGVKG